MVFLSICTALYQYVPQSEGELPIEEGDLVCILEKSTEDDWWKAMKKSTEEGKEDLMGLIPNNYVEEAHPTHHAKALYDYSRQTDEELSLVEDTGLAVYDTSDPDWTLVGSNGEYGFAPASYIEITGEAGARSPTAALSPRSLERHVDMEHSPITDSGTSPPQSPATALAGIMHKQKPTASPVMQRSAPYETSTPQGKPQYTPEDSDEESPNPPAPSLPQRPISSQASPPPAPYVSPPTPEPPGVIESPPYSRVQQGFTNGQGPSSPGGYHLYNINEMISALGKKKKLPTTLGINLSTGRIMIAPEKSRDGPQQEWTAEKLTHYSIEGKHVFMELIRPSKSIDFHAGAKDTAHEIVGALGELAGAVRAEGLKEVIAAGAGSGKSQRKGQVLYEFMAQGDDEVTVAVGDEVIVLDDTKSEEWWMVRRLRNGKEGVVPSSYVEIIGITSPLMSSITGLNTGRSTVEQHRLEEERLSREALKASKKREHHDTRGTEVGPGMKLPKRGSSLSGGHDINNSSSQRSKRDSRSDGRSNTATKSKPDSSKVRTWTDRSGSFKVEAQFIGLKDGKIHLHKLNGVKIAVPVVKMAVEDLEYVERATGVSLDEDKPLSDIRRKNQKATNGNDRIEKPLSPTASNAGVSVQQKPKPPEYDWFDFFLKCGVSPYQCERYAFNFNRDSMDETILPDVTPSVLRTLGLKEGDILRVMKFLDTKFGRSGAKSKLRNVSFSPEQVMGNEEDGESDVTSPGGGLFSGPGGTLRNNTRKGRPAPTIQTNDIVDSKAFQSKVANDEPKPDRQEKVSAPPTSTPAPFETSTRGFDDDAWDVKPAKQPTGVSQSIQSAPTAPASAPSQPTLSGSLADLSLLSKPLEPVIVHQTGLQQPSQAQPSFQPHQTQAQNLPQQQTSQYQLQQPLQLQPTGTNPSFFAPLNQQFTGVQPQQSFVPQNQPQQFIPQQSGQGQLGFNQQQPGQGPPAFNPQQTGQNPVGFSPQQTGQGQLGFQLNPAPRQRPQAPQLLQQNSLLPPPPRPLSAPQNASAQSNFGPPPLQPQLTGALNQGFAQNQNLSATPSLNDLNRLRLQQQFGQQQVLQPQPTGFGQAGQNSHQLSNGYLQQSTQFGQQHGLAAQPTGYQQPPLYLNGQQTGSPFADPRSPPQQAGIQPTPTSFTGFPPSTFGSLAPQQTGSINSVLSPALQPQPTGVNGFNRPGFGQAGAPPPPPPPIPQQQTLAPLQPQKTGPAPPVRFGVTGETKKLIPQPTGRRANLSQATPENPFGF